MNKTRLAWKLAMLSREGLWRVFVPSGGEKPPLAVKGLFTGPARFVGFAEGVADTEDAVFVEVVGVPTTGF